MAKTVTIRLDDHTYESIKKAAESEKRPISNFVEYATLKYIEETAFVDDSEMLEIMNNPQLLERLRTGSKQAKEKRGNFVA